MPFLTPVENAVLRNMRKKPAVPTGDPVFDALVQDIFRRMEARDSKVLALDDDILTVIGLYDQVVEGILPVLNPI
jgi:hypothetical protein